jgi:murein DD-endopeptidase MepM/ murein hydrolase activator NlpD
VQGKNVLRLMPRANRLPLLPARGTSTFAACVAVITLLALGGFAALLFRAAPARAVNIGQLQQQISAGQSHVSALAGVVGAYSNRLARLDAGIAGLERRLSKLQADLNAKEAELIRLKIRLTLARNRLARLQAFEARGEATLARQLVNNYEADRPDLVSVVLESSGFQDLLERLQFAQRIQKQNVRIIKAVKVARREVAAQAVRLGALEVRQQALTQQVLNERNAVAATRATLLRQRIAVARARGAKASRLAAARSHVASLQHQLSQAEAAQAAAAARAAADIAQSSGSSAAPPAGAPVASSGGFVFPLPKSAASGPGSWSEDQGVDISAPGNTPEYAVCSGTIVLHGIGGFGSWAPVLHCDSAIDGYSYVYYGHAGPADQLAVGTHVGAGSVMSSVGPGIVGISTGPHLEIGFADSSGSPIGGASASAMMSLLQSSY